MAKFTQTYPTDLKYREWQQIEQYLPTYTRGRPPNWARWLIVNAILYVTRTGCQGRMLPDSFPPWPTVYGYFRRWTAAGVWERLNAVRVRPGRTQAGREPEPRAAKRLGWRCTSKRPGASGIMWSISWAGC
jgi:putative transposase